MRAPVFNLTERRAYYRNGYNYWTDITAELDPASPRSWPHIMDNHVYGIRLESVGSDFMVGSILTGTQVTSRDHGMSWQTSGMMFQF